MRGLWDGHPDVACVDSYSLFLYLSLTIDLLCVAITCTRSLSFPFRAIIITSLLAILVACRATRCGVEAGCCHSRPQAVPGQQYGGRGCTWCYGCSRLVDLSTSPPDFRFVPHLLSVCFFNFETAAFTLNWKISGTLACVCVCVCVCVFARVHRTLLHALLPELKSPPHTDTHARTHARTHTHTHTHKRTLEHTAAHGRARSCSSGI